MSRREIGELRTLRIIPKSEDIYQHILALEFELIYELYPSDRMHDRNQTFINEHYHAQRRDSMQWSENRLYFPGPKLWVRSNPFIKPKTEEEYKRLEKLANDHDFIEFAIQRNGGVEELVPLLFDNVRLTLDELGIQEIKYEIVPESIRLINIKRRKFYREDGGYEKARIGILHPELRSKSLRDSLVKSYRSVNGTLPPTAELFDILKDYSRIIFREVSTQTPS